MMGENGHDGHDGHDEHDRWIMGIMIHIIMVYILYTVVILSQKLGVSVKCIDCSYYSSTFRVFYVSFLF
jgi:hypothetical protein